jgi:CRISPR/Cas system Type II protein with McrA/HNH and RuvC-like nuclease domain
MADKLPANFGPLTFGFDIGIASVGWCVLNETHIVDLGVRGFDPGEDSDGKPHNQTRRAARVARNRLRMRRWRLNQLLRLFCDVEIIPRPDAQLLMTPPRTKGEPEMGPWQLRAQGLERQLDPVEWARVLYHLVKHRGFEFFRRSDLKSAQKSGDLKEEPNNGTKSGNAPEEEVSAAKEKEKLNQALEASSKLLEKYRKIRKNPHLTVAELAIWLAQDNYASNEPRPDEQDRINSFRNKAGSYHHAFFRAALRHELEILFAAQTQKQNLYTGLELPADSEYLRQMLVTFKNGAIPIGGGSRSIGRTFQEAVFDLFDLQHPPLYAEQIRKMVGECELIAGQPRASKNSFSAERATWLETLNKLRIRRNGKEEPLSPEERSCLRNIPYEHSKVTLKLARETLMTHTGFPASWQEASFNAATYRAKPANDGAWILIVPQGEEPVSLTKWANNKERKEKLKEAKKLLTGGLVTYKQLREKLGLMDSDRFICRIKDTSIIPRKLEAETQIQFASSNDKILVSGHSFRYITAEGKPKALPKGAWKLVTSLRVHSSATLADWRSLLASLKDMGGNWQFEYSIQKKYDIGPDTEEQTQVPLQFEDAQAVEVDQKLAELKGWHTLRLALADKFPDKWNTLQVAYQNPTSDAGMRAASAVDDIATTLTECQTDQEIEQRLNTLGYDKGEIKTLQTISFNKFRNLGFEALRKILPYLEDGYVYSKACELAGLKHSEKETQRRTHKLPLLETFVYQRHRHGELTGHVEKRYKELLNPVVARSFNQARLVFNALVEKHGSPTYVHVETARDLARSKKLRDKISWEQKTNSKRAEGIKEDLRNRLGREPTQTQILKMRLYGEQNGQCMYSGASLEPFIDSMLKDDSGDVEIDHIWPRSKTFDNSLDNRTLVKTGANRDKGSKIPYEFFGGANGDKRWHIFEQRVLSCKGISAEKQRRLLSQTLEDADEFLARNLIDTRYATRMFANMLRERVFFANSPSPGELEAISPDDDGKTRWNRYQHARVRSPQGRLVDFLRGKWGLAHAKDREKSDLHHAVDACIIAACTPSIIQRINNYFAEEEAEPHKHIFHRNSDGTYTHRGTGEIVSKAEARERGLFLPALWDDVDEGKFRRDLLAALDKVFISRRPKRKSAGELHDANPKSIRYLPVPLVDLTMDMLADEHLQEITGRRRENFEILREALRLANGDAKVAFNNGYEIIGENNKPQRIEHLMLPVWSLPDGYLLKRRKDWAKINKKGTDENFWEPIENFTPERKSISLVNLKKEDLDATKLARLDQAFYDRNKKLIEDLQHQLNNFSGDASKAFTEPFFPPKGVTGKKRSAIRTIRIPVEKKFIESVASTQKSIPLTNLKKEMLSEGKLGSAFYYRNKELLDALKKQLDKFNDDPKKAFAEPFCPPKGKSGKERPSIRSIRLPDTQGSGMLVRGGISGLGDSISTEVYRTDSGFFFRPRYQADEGVMFGLEEPPAGAKRLFNLRIDDPIEVTLTTSEVIPGGGKPGYFVVYEGDGRMRIRTHDRPGKTPRKTKKVEDENKSAESQQAGHDAKNLGEAEDDTLFRFQTKQIKELKKFKVDVLGNYKEL